MDPQMTFLSSKDRETYDTWSKDQIYLAYIQEREARIQLNMQLNTTNRILAEIKFKATI